MRRVPMHRSIWKPIMFMGCERTPFMIVAISSALLVMNGGFWGKVLGVVYFLVAVGIIAFLNAKDPQYFQILFRYTSRQDFYPNNAPYPGKSDHPKNF